MDTFNTTPPATVLLMGGGVRGQNYTSYALVHPHRIQVIGVAEPRNFQRNRIQRLHKIADENVFKDWKELVSRDKFADGVIIATPTEMHKDPAIAFVRKGYHVMVEAPMATTEADCQEVAGVCQENNVIVCVCHVLRYSPPAVKIKELIESGAIGDVVNIQHMEQLGIDYSTETLVRGCCRRADMVPFILGKCIHDIDLISHWLGKRKQGAKVSAFGHRSHFTKENKPENATDLCRDCPVEANCPYSAQKIYLEPFKQGYRGFPVNGIVDVLDIEHVTEAVQSLPYGKCVYACDNDVPTHVGEIYCKFGGPVEHVNFRTRQKTVHNFDPPGIDVPLPLTHYWGSDYNVIDCFARALQEKDETLIKSGAVQSLPSYRLTFAADRAMKEKVVVNVQ